MSSYSFSSATANKARHSLKGVVVGDIHCKTNRDIIIIILTKNEAVRPSVISYAIILYFYT